MRTAVTSPGNRRATGSGSARSGWPHGGRPARRSRTPEPDRSSPRPVLLLGLLVAAGLVGALWAGSQLAGLLFSGRPLPLSPEGTLPVALRLLAHPGHPERAWARPLRPTVGPVAVWAPAVLAVAAGTVGIGLLARRIWRALRRPSSWPRVPPAASRRLERRLERRLSAGNARWARPSDLRTLIVRRPTGHRLVVGRVGRHLVALEDAHSLLVVGPTQSGKTTGLAIPAVLEWDGPVVATSVKADILRATVSRRKVDGETWLVDPTALVGTDLRRHSWSPLHACSDWAQARRVATELTTASRSGPPGGEGDFWYAAAAKWLAPLLLAAALDRREMDTVLSWIEDDDPTEPDALLARAGEDRARRALAANERREERQRSSILTTAETVIEPFAELPGRGEPADLDRLFDGGRHTLYVVAPVHDQRRLRPYFECLVSEILERAVRHAEAAGGRLSSPLLLVVDEAANIAPIADLDAVASTAAGQGIQLVTIWQDLAQLTARYGARAPTVVNNHRAKLVLSGLADATSLAELSSLVGDTITVESSQTLARDGSASTTRAPGLRRLAAVDQLRRLPPGAGLLLYGHLPPAVIRLRPPAPGPRPAASRPASATRSAGDHSAGDPPARWVGDAP